MDDSLLLTVILAVVLVAVGLLIAFPLRKGRRRGGQTRVDYRALFILGVCFVSVGIVGNVMVDVVFSGVLSLGIVYTIAGFANKGKWKR